MPERDDPERLQALSDQELRLLCYDKFSHIYDRITKDTRQDQIEAWITGRQSFISTTEAGSKQSDSDTNRLWPWLTEHIKWVFSGIGVAVIATVISYYSIFQKPEAASTPSDNNIIQRDVQQPINIQDVQGDVNINLQSTSEPTAEATPEPEWMTGDFNIAVAEFVEEPPSRNPTIAPVASQMIFSFLDSEYQLGDFGKVQISHDRIGVVPGATEAETLTKKINADVVIYGAVNLVGDEALILPKFYVAESFRSDLGEINGQHQLALPVEFPTADLIRYRSEVNIILRQRTVILTEFTRGLVYLAADDLHRALDAMEGAIGHSDEYGDFEGKEVLYLFAAHITTLLEDFEQSEKYIDQALNINDSYARAYLAKANIYYAQKEFDLALDYYDQAERIEEQPYGAYISEKANLGIANIYIIQYQTADEMEKAGMAAHALSHYEAVINSYQSQSRPASRLIEFAAGAYYSSGFIFQLEGDFDEALKAFEQTIALTQEFDLRKQAQDQYDTVKQILDK